MKKTIAVIIALITLCICVSCGGNKTSAAAENVTSPDGKWVLTEVGQGNGNTLTSDEISGYRCYEFSGGNGTYTVNNPVKNETRKVTLEKSDSGYTIHDSGLTITDVKFEDGKMTYADSMDMSYVFTKE